MNILKIFITILFLLSINSISQESKWLTEIKTNRPDTSTIKAYLQLFRFYASSNPDQSLKYCREGIKVANKIKDEFGEAQLISALGTLHFRTVKIDSALYCFKTALPTFIKLNKLQDEANVYRQMGMVADYESNYKLATTYYLKAVSICEQIGHKKLLASCLGNLGILHERQGHQQQALNYYRRCEILFTQSSDSTSLPMVYTNIGNVYDNLGLFDSCFYYYTKAEIIAREINHIPMLALLSYNIGNIHHQQNNQEKALEYFKNALQLNEQLDERDNIIGCYMQIGNVLCAMRKFKEAEPYLLKSMQLAKEADYKSMIAKNYEVLAHFYAEQKMYDKAYEAQKDFLIARDSMLNEENQNAMAELEKKFETEKKQHEIDNLNKENALQQAEVGRQNLLKYLFASGFLIMAVVAWFIFKGLQEKKKANRLITEQKQEVEKQKELVEEKQKEILDSITYARRIQRALITQEKYIYKSLSRLM